MKKTKSAKSNPNLPGPNNVPAVNLNPRAKYTIVSRSTFSVPAPLTIAPTFGQLTQAVVAQLSTQQPVNLLSLPIPATVPWKNAIVKRVRIWGVTSGRVSLAFTTTRESIVPPSIKFDESAGTADRPYVDKSAPPLLWGLASATSVPFTVTATNADTATEVPVNDEVIVHVTVEVW